MEVTIGEHRFGEDTLRLVVDHPDTFVRIEEALRDGRNRLDTHLRAKAIHDPALSQLDSRQERGGAATDHYAIQSIR